MLSQRINNFVKSYFIVNLKTKNYEKTLNLLRRKNVVMWDINKIEDGISFKIYKKDFEKNKQFFNDININPVRKVGIMFKINKLHKRLGFIAGALILILYIFIYCSFAWNVRIMGNESIVEEEIIKVLSENKIKTPIKIKKVDNKQIESLLYTNFKSIKFVEAHIDGINIVVNIREKNESDYLQDDKSPSSIISNKQAVIYKTLVKQGQLLVQEGEVVSKGQVLVKGVKRDKDNTEKLVNSEATILGHTYYNLSFTEPKIHNIKQETGKTNKVYKLVFKDNKIKIFGNVKKFKDFDVVTKSVHIPLITDFFKISFEVNKNFEVKYVEQEISKEYAENKLFINLYEKLVKICNKNVKIDKQDFVFEETENEYILRAKIEATEDIGEKIKIYSFKED